MTQLFIPIIFGTVPQETIRELIANVIDQHRLGRFLQALIGLPTTLNHRRENFE